MKHATIPEAVRKWQRDALPHVSELSKFLGIPFQTGNRRWVESNSNPGYFAKDGERDTIAFIPYRADKIVRKIHDIVPAGELDNVLALVDHVGPNDYDSEETLGWTRGTSRTLTDTDSQTHGWSTTVSLGFELGVEGKKVVGGIELGAHGDYSHETANEKGSDAGGSHSTKIDLPRGEIAKMLQSVRSGPGVADVEDLIVLAVGFKVADWKRPTNDYLKDHSGFSKKGRSKSRWHWDVPDVNDLRMAFEGTNPRYPRMVGRNFTTHGSVSSHYRWLMDPRNRTVRVRSRAHFDVAVFGEARVQRIGVDGKVLADYLAQD